MALNQQELQKNIAKLRKSLKKTAKRPTPGRVHQMRTRARRFEAEDQALSLTAWGSSRGLVRRLKKLGKKAGKVRDMDVLTSHLCGIRVEGEEECQIQLLHYLGHERYRQASRLSKALKKATPKIRRKLKRLEGELEDLAKNGNANGANEQAAQDVAAEAMRLSAELRDPAQLTRGNLHPYRLKIKELRYVVQMADGKEHEEFAGRLGECKDAIGEWHDWEELIALAAELLDHGPRCGLIAELKTVSNEKFASALAVTNRMRKSYAPAVPAQKKTGNPEGRVSQPALRVVSKIAS